MIITPCSIESLKENIRETFAEYGEDIGFDMNVAGVCKLFKDGLITRDEYKELRKYNRTYYHELPIVEPQAPEL